MFLVAQDRVGGFMPRGPEPKVPRPAWSTALRARRVALDLKQEDVAARTEDQISQGTISDLERGKVDIRNMTASRLSALSSALEWTPQELEGALGLRIMRVVTTDLSDLEVATTLHPLREARDGVVKLADDGMVEVPVYGMAAAHSEGNMTSTRPVGMTRIPKNLLRENRHAYLVLGDSMDDGGRRGIQDGDTVLCDQADLDLKEGGVFIVKVPGNGILLKRVRTYEDGIMYLESDNRKYRPLQPDEAEIIGRVVWVAPQGFAP